jgi:hypothetical protein
MLLDITNNAAEKILYVIRVIQEVSGLNHSQGGRQLALAAQPIPNHEPVR